MTQKIYNSGGYWFLGSQLVTPNALPVIWVGFDPLEELIWTLTRTGRVTAYFGPMLDRYVSFPLPAEAVAKAIIPSPDAESRFVYTLVDNALFAHYKTGLMVSCAQDPQMTQLECACPTNAVGGALMDSSLSGGMCNMARFFLGGLTSNLLEVDSSNERWGQVRRTFDIGPKGCVILRTFTGGLCTANTGGEIRLVDPRVSKGTVREFQAHSTEISDFVVTSNMVVTCGWAQYGEGAPRVERLLKVFDLRAGKLHTPIPISIDPQILKFQHDDTGTLLCASQMGTIQTIKWNNNVPSAGEIITLPLNYDPLVSMDISRNNQTCVFATEMGQVQLFTRNIDAAIDPMNAQGQFFDQTPCETLFGETLADSLQAAMPDAYPGMQLKLNALAQSASNMAELRILGDVHCNQNMQPTDQLLAYTEASKLEAANDLLQATTRPVDYDNVKFHSSSLPYASEPAPLIDSMTGQVRMLDPPDEKRPAQLSDWPREFIGRIDRQALVITDPSLVKCTLATKTTARKPEGWYKVWHPYSDPQNMALLREQPQS